MARISTKRGDRGETQSLGGDTYPKSHPVIECSGKVDALRAAMALCRTQLLESGPDDPCHLGESLLWLLHVSFLIGAQCSDPTNKRREYRKGDVSKTHLERLEAEEDRLEERVTLPKKFIVCASNTLAAQFDWACVVARELERSVVRLKAAVPEFDDGHILPFVNRLSDFLYLAARSVEEGKHDVVDYGLLEE